MTHADVKQPEGSTLIKRAMRGSEIRKSVDVEGRLARGALEHYRMTDITDTDDSEAVRIGFASLISAAFRNHPIILTEQGPFELFGHALSAGAGTGRGGR